MKSNWLLVTSYGLLLLIVDQATKHIFHSGAIQGHPLILSITPLTVTLGVAATTITGLLVILSYTKLKIAYKPEREKKLLIKIGIINILAGGISNFIDLATRGFVTDIINLATLHLNLADVYIVLGSSIIFIAIFKNHRVKKLMQ